MRLFLAILLFQIIAGVGTAQNIDSLYTTLVTALNLSPEKSIQIGNEIYPVKCATNQLHTLREHFTELTKQQQNEISKLLSRPATDASFVTPSGLFRIHYDNSGMHAPEYNLDELALALDSSYNFEINKLGYLKPPSDDGEGGDNLYDVYIQDLGVIYGYTEFFDQSNSPSFMVIDNNYDLHYTNGINGAKVTVAHEFHHAIQVGNYKYRSDDSFYYEMLSTSMEEFVFDSINDYYDYIPSYYRNTQAAFYETNGGGYDLAVWNLFMREKYGFDVIKKSLENLSDYNAMESIAVSIASAGGSFKEDLAEFGIWNYFTNSRSKPGEYFQEAQNYPKVKPAISMPFDSNYESVSQSSNPSSNIYFQFIDISRGLPDTLAAIITNSDYRTKSKTSFEYTVYNYNAGGSNKINDYYYSNLSSFNKSLFVESAIFNNELAAEGVTEREEIDFAFPQPFNYSKHTFVFIPTAPDVSGTANLNVYTSGMDLVFSAEKNIFATDKIVLRWDGKTEDGKKLPTGIYIYITKAGDTIKKGKLVIYNE